MARRCCARLVLKADLQDALLWIVTLALAGLLVLLAGAAVAP